MSGRSPCRATQRRSEEGQDTRRVGCGRVAINIGVLDAGNHPQLRARRTLERLEQAFAMRRRGVLVRIALDQQHGRIAGHLRGRMFGAKTHFKFGPHELRELEHRVRERVVAPQAATRRRRGQCSASWLNWFDFFLRRIRPKTNLLLFGVCFQCA